jgi:putative serine protease PepD
VVCALVCGALVAACGGQGARHHAARTAAHRATASSGRAEGQSVADAADSLQQQFVKVIERVSPEVVQVSDPQGLGSGISFHAGGYIVTNAHVVAGGGPYKVTDASGRTVSATLVGEFVPDDLAVVRARGLSLPVASFARTRSLQVGDVVLAVGNPLGLRSSVTNGIISALGRTVDEPNGVVLPDVIQTSAPINPGNSGGALVNLAGQVVGIPTLAATDPQLGGGAAPGIGFAIPSSIVTDIASQIVAHGHVVDSHRAFLGVELASGLQSGAVVVAVLAGSPAARAGIRAGDLITAIDSTAVSSPEDVAGVLATLAPGQRVRVSFTTPSGASRTVTVRLGQYPGGG